MWNRFQGDEQADGEIPEGKAVELPPQETKIDQAPQGLTINTKRQVPREFYITKTDAENHGYTPRCPGCGSLFRGVGKQPHTAECRERFRNLMSDDARVHAVGKPEKAALRRGRTGEKRRKKEKREDEARKKKREEEEVETSRKRTCQSSGSSDGVVLGRGSKRKMEDNLGDDQMQMETEEIAEVEVQRWMNVMLVEEEQIELKARSLRTVEETIVGRGAVAKRWMPSKLEMGGRRERRWIDKERAGCQSFQRFGLAPGRLLRSYTTIGSCKDRIEYGSHEEQQWSSEESHYDRCQESTLESALQGGRSASSYHQKSGQSRVSVASSTSGCTDSARRRRRGKTSMLRLWRRQVFEEELGAR